MDFNPRLNQILAGTVFAFLAAAAFGAARPASDPELVVHEWGTFTSVAGADGQAVPWRPFSGPTDLPCFVNVVKDSPKTWVPGGLPAMSALVRMETPVIYFYAPSASERTVDVRVDFNQGLLTEWYPLANVAPQFLPKDLAANVSRLEWNRVRIAPDAPRSYPTENVPSHYYAARETAANAVRVNGQSEKFLFYRGLASFPTRLTATATGQDVRIENSGRDLSRAVLFQRRGTRVGYRLTSLPRGVTTIAAPSLDGSIDGLGAELERLLVESGLFVDEAKAMVATWRDSWFEEGTRVFYLVPPADVDATLPLHLRPAPARIVRTFVGRFDLATPADLDDIERALRAGNARALLPYARFIEPFTMQVLSRAPDIDRTRVDNMLRLVLASTASEYECRP